MRAASFIVAGDYSDAYLYGDWLVLVGDRGEITQARLLDLARALEQVAAIPRRLADALVVDNKQLTEARRHRLANTVLADEAHPIVEPEVHRTLDRFTNSVVFDIEISYFKAFVACEEGLFAIDVFSRSPSVKQRSPHFCVQASPRWNALAMACADEGAWLLLGEVRSSVTALDRQQNSRQLSNRYSDRMHWAGSTLFAFGESRSSGLFQAEVGKGRSKHEAKGVIEVSSSDLRGELQGMDDRYVQPCRGGLLTIDRDGLVVFDPFFRMPGELIVSGALPIGDLGQARRFRSVAETDGGFVFEEDWSLVQLDDDGTSTLHANEVSSLRSYPQSRRFRRVVTAVVEDGLLVSVLLGQLPFDIQTTIPLIS